MRWAVPGTVPPYIVPLFVFATAERSAGKKNKKHLIFLDDMLSPWHLHDPPCIWLTGLSASGKTTVSHALHRALTARQCRCALIDGDALRLAHHHDLAYSASDRDENVRRAARLARRFTLEGILPICALISPRRHARDEARLILSPSLFFECFLDTPLPTCEARDPKGLYAAARRGDIENFTGISSPYEAPEAPDLRLCGGSPEQQAHEILAALFP